ncbi:chorismate synthase [candidate division KSB1 bacterium]
MIRYLTAGESHGQALTAIIEGMPAGLKIDADFINHELWRRQQGYGRGGRMKIESDKVNILSGVRFGETTGAPITLQIENKDWENWQKRMSVEKPEAPDDIKKVTIPRPGHTDLAGAIKYGHDDIRNIIERSSARETAIRTAAGAVMKLFLKEFGITIGSHVIEIHEAAGNTILDADDIEELSKKADSSPVRCLDPDAEKNMIAAIDSAKENGDTVGGRIEVLARGIPVGLGSFMQADRKLDGRIAGALMAIPAIKEVEIGMGIETGRKYGSEVHDPINIDNSGPIKRTGNNAGGIEGGVSNGEPITAKITMKPISSLISPLDSVDIQTRESVKSRFERSDVCAVPAASIVAEAVLALVLAEAFTEKFSGDHIHDIKYTYDNRRKL